MIFFSSSVAASLSFARPAFSSELQSAPGGAPFRLDWREAVIGRKPAEKRVRTPREMTRQALYITLQVGDSTDTLVTGALDKTARDSAAFDTLYLDANNNNDLSDDPVLRPRISTEQQTFALNLDPVPVTVKYSDGSRRHVLIQFEIRGFRAEDKKDITWSVAYHAAEHRRGTVDLGARKNVLVEVYDGADKTVPGNAVFNNWGIDRFRIDSNGDGRLDEQTEDFPLSRLVVADGALYEMDLDRAGVRLTLSPARLPTGNARFRLHLAEGAVLRHASVLLADVDHPDRAFGFEIKPDLPVALPEGSYRIDTGRMSATGTGTNAWAALFSCTNAFHVRKDAVVEIAIGMPMKARPYVESPLRPGVKSCVLLELVGAGGETYQNIAPEKSRMMPAIAILDAEDVAVVRGNMEYG